MLRGFETHFLAIKIIYRFDPIHSIRFSHVFTSISLKKGAYRTEIEFYNIEVESIKEIADH